MPDVQNESSLRLLPQEREGRYHFNGPFVATRDALERFGDGVILAALELVRRQAALQAGLDYLQVLEVGGEKLWVIDDVSVVTVLLPDDH